MRKGIPLFLSIVLIFNSLGFLYLFNYNRYLIRKEIKLIIKQSVPAAELTILKDCLTSASDDFKWENKKEFWKNHQLYDVVHKVQIGDTIFYRCIRDTQEEKLFSQLHRYVSDNIEGTGLFKTKHRMVVKQTITSLFFEKTTIDRYSLPPLHLVFSYIPWLVVSDTIIVLPPPKSNCYNLVFAIIA